MTLGRWTLKKRSVYLFFRWLCNTHCRVLYTNLKSCPKGVILLGFIFNLYYRNMRKILLLHQPPASWTSVCPSPLLHFAVTHENWTGHTTHSSMSFGCIVPLNMKKSKNSTHFTFGGRLSIVRGLFTCSQYAPNWQLWPDMLCYILDGHTRGTT